MNRVLFLSTAALFLAAMTGHAQLDTLQHENTARTYLLHVPGTYDSSVPVPVVLAFHGWYQSPQVMEKATKLSDMADTENFIAVYPAGIVGSERAWNEQQGGVDDVGFIDQLLDTLIARYNIDTKRIYATGFSSGAGMCYRLAHLLAHRIAAIAPVAGCIIYEWAPPTRAVPVIQFKSRNDNYDSVLPVMDYWIRANGCKAQSTVISTADGGDGQIWQAQSNHAAVVLYSRDTGGHSWPNASSPTPATDLLWTFFKDHPWEEAPSYPAVNGIELHRDDLPLNCRLLVNYPNPFNPDTQIGYTLDNPARVRLSVYNSRGQRIVQLVDTFQSAGYHTALFSGDGLESGVYVAVLISDRGVQRVKMILMK